MLLVEIEDMLIRFPIYGTAASLPSLAGSNIGSITSACSG